MLWMGQAGGGKREWADLTRRKENDFSFLIKGIFERDSKEICKEFKRDLGGKEKGKGFFLS